MKLRSLHLHGFKSFADRTQIEFRDGVTAIVGSNGCGKSNTADAVRWVLGEQRASAVRGAKMEEVIFQGTTRRRPLNFAEVALVFSNEDGSVAIPQTEIEVTRKVFREGGSEYALNRTSCRLRDIHDLLRDTGLGSNAYSIIEAGMIDTILSERAEERRALFEEAAGIGKYKDRRRSAQRRLDAAEGDLARLADLLGEVESKVRVLARQRRRAQRHAELQARKMALEVALARAETDALALQLADMDRRREALERAETEARTARITAEAVAEQRRIEAAELGRRRLAVAARLDDVRRRLDAREREILLADERRSHTDLRIAQLVRERAELTQRASALAAESGRWTGRRDQLAGTLDAICARLEARTSANEALRAELARLRQGSEAAESAARDLARQIAVAEGERSALARGASEAEARRLRLVEQAARVAEELSALDSQTELWSSRTDELRVRSDAAAEIAETAREEIRMLRGRESAARESLREAEDRLARLTSQLAAREAMERSYEGFGPAVAALMEVRDRIGGVLGPLADFVDAADGESADAAAVESFLGTLLQAVVVRDLGTVRAVRRWFRDEWEGGGSLLLLPLDAPGARAPESPPALSTAVRGRGEGARWVDTFLAGVVVLSGEDPLGDFPSGARVDQTGDVVDPRGVVRLGQPASGEGILARREALARLRAEENDASAERERCEAARSTLREAVAAAEERMAEAEEIRRSTEAELRRVDADAAAHGHHRTRLVRERVDLTNSLEATRTAAAEGAERLAELDRRLAELVTRAEGADDAARSASADAAGVQAVWEEARDEESEIRITLARVEGELRDAERALSAATVGAEAARGRGATLEAEAGELRASLEGLSGVREQAGSEIQALFAARDRDAAELANVEARLAELEAGSAEAEAEGRAARRGESAAADERHRLELERAELVSRLERTRERVEVEWGRPWSVLASAADDVAGDAEAWKAEVRETGAQLAALGPINMLAVEEHEEEARRLTFLTEQRDDLTRARDDLVAAIRQINRTAREVFMETFTTVRDNFHRTFFSLFQGGECDVWLTDADDPLESPIEIHASPRGKRTQRIHLLSGGERTLTALSLLFAIYLVKPSPFCLFDEVDAPLDESNVGRFIQLLADFKEKTQFVVITHNPRTMEAADWIYGVTMEEPGVSSVVGVELAGAWAFGEQVA